MATLETPLGPIETGGSFAAVVLTWFARERATTNEMTPAESSSCRCSGEGLRPIRMPSNKGTNMTSLSPQQGPVESALLHERDITVIEVPNLDVEVCYVEDRRVGLIRAGLPPRARASAEAWLYGASEERDV